MKNRIPRNFYGITGKMLIYTTETQPGDIIHITKNNCGYCVYNRRTNKTFYMSLAIIRNAEFFAVTETVK